MTTIIKDCDYWLNKIKNDGWDLKYVPEEFKTYKLCLKAVKQVGYALQHVPEELKTYELCLGAVKEDGWALQHVPAEFKTYELCLKAVKRYGWALKYVPEELKTKELCLETIKSNGYTLGFIPEKFKTYEFFLELVKQNGYILGYTPEGYKTKELQLMALGQNPSAIDYASTNTLPISEWKVEWFKKLWNIELRRQFIKERGKEVLDQLKLEEIDKNEEYKLVKFKYGQDQIGHQKALLYKCPSSGDVYLTEVNKKIRTVKGAVRFLNNGSNKEELEFES